jgi:hypothetical protein
MYYKLICIGVTERRGRRQRERNGGGGARCRACGGAEKRCLTVQSVAGQIAKAWLPYIWAGRRRRGGEMVGEAAVGGVLSRHRLLKGETTGQRRFMGKLKRSQWRVGSAPYGCGWASIGGEWSGDASRGRWLGLRPEEEEDPGGPELGRVHWAQRLTGPISMGYKKNGGGPHEGMG